MVKVLKKIDDFHYFNSFHINIFFRTSRLRHLHLAQNVKNLKDDFQRRSFNAPFFSYTYNVSIFTIATFEEGHLKSKFYNFCALFVFVMLCFVLFCFVFCPRSKSTLLNSINKKQNKQNKQNANSNM